MRHAPVATYDLRLAGDAIVGHAAPAVGRLPCLLALEADDETLAIASATRFCENARVDGMRLGWCGVRLDGIAVAGAIADTVLVRCMASGAILLSTDAPSAEYDTPPLTVDGILAQVRRIDCCDDPAAILPFAEASLRRHGLPAMLDHAYRTLLGRAADEMVVADWIARPPGEPARAALAMIVDSPEFRDAGRAIPGPFHPAFAFTLSPFEASDQARMRTGTDFAAGT